MPSESFAAKQNERWPPQCVQAAKRIPRLSPISPILTRHGEAAGRRGNPGSVMLALDCVVAPRHSSPWQHRRNPSGTRARLHCSRGKAQDCVCSVAPGARLPGLARSAVIRRCGGLGRSRDAIGLRARRRALCPPSRIGRARRRVIGSASAGARGAIAERSGTIAA